MVHDLRNATFDELLDFFFDNPSSAKSSNNWFVDMEALYDPIHNAHFFCQLFKTSSILLQKFDPVKIDRGIWAVSAYAFDGNAYDVVLQDSSVPFELKQACIKAMYDLFKDLFSVLPCEASAFWWGRFAGYKRGAAWSPGDGVKLADTIFETLLRILSLDSDYCRACSLDGIAELRHRDTNEELRAFVRQNNRMDAQTRQQILKIAEFNPPFPNLK